MSRLPRPDEAEGYTYRLPCDECGGEGGKRTIVPHAGEAVAADIYEDVCAACDGTGEEDQLRCMGCDAPIPPSGVCEGCNTLHLDARRAA